MKAPVVSVIIICYNYGKYLSEAIQSIVDQTYTDWECIVIDDGSTDNTKKIATEFAFRDARIFYIHQQNSGPSAARNTGLRVAKGEYVQFLDADDYIHPKKIEEQVVFLRNNPDVDLVYGDVITFKDIANEERFFYEFKYATKQVSGGEAILKELVWDSVFLINTFVVKKSLLERLAYFDEDISRHEDWILWNKMALSGANFVYSKRETTISYVRAHEGSLTSDKKEMWMNRIDARLKLENYIPLLLENRPIDNCIKDYIKTNAYLLKRDRYRFELFFGSIAKGLYFLVYVALTSSKFYEHAYDGLYWIKERMKRKL